MILCSFIFLFLILQSSFFIRTSIITDNAPESPLESARTAWNEVFTEGPYTSFVMFQYIMTRLEKTHQDCARTEKVLQTIKHENLEPEDIDGPMAYTWNLKTGRCTSFALKVVSLLESRHQNIFDFRFHDLKGHRAARCLKTGVVIDSSSMTGAFVLPEGQ